MGGMLQAFAGQSVEEYSAAADAFLRGGQHPTLGRALPRVRLPADDRPARLPRGERVHQLHRLRRRPRLHAAGHGGDLRHPVRARDRQLERALATPTTSTAAASSTRRRRTSSTTGRSSRCGSGAGSAGARSSPAATRTATSRCSATPAGRGGPRCGCCVLHDDEEREFAYTAGAETSLETARRARLDGGQHQERLGDGVRLAEPAPERRDPAADAFRPAAGSAPERAAARSSPNARSLSASLA